MHASEATYSPGPTQQSGILALGCPGYGDGPALRSGVGAAHGIGRGRAWHRGRRLIRSDGRASLSVSNDGTLLYSTGGARYQLAWFGRDGTPRGTVGAYRCSTSGCASRQTAARFWSPSGIRRQPAGTSGRSISPVGIARRVTLEDSGWYGVWSPDSQQVAFTAESRREVLNAKKTRGAGEVENLLTFDAQMLPKRLVTRREVSGLRDKQPGHLH